MIEKAVKSCLETEKQLKDQMATLKKNRDNVPLDLSLIHISEPTRRS